MTSLKYLLNEGRIEAVEPDLDVARDKIEEQSDTWPRPLQ